MSTSTQSKRGGQGSHGSITKAGKVRRVSPMDWTNARRVVKPIKTRDKATNTMLVTGTVTMIRLHKKKHGGPRISKKRIAFLRDNKHGLDRKAGQWCPPTKE